MVKTFIVESQSAERKNWRNSVSLLGESSSMDTADRVDCTFPSQLDAHTKPMDHTAAARSSSSWGRRRLVSSGTAPQIRQHSPPATTHLSLQSLEEENAKRFQNHAAIWHRDSRLLGRNLNRLRLTLLVRRGSRFVGAATCDERVSLLSLWTVPPVQQLAPLGYLREWQQKGRRTP